jgi:hypothetical protein
MIDFRSLMVVGYPRSGATTAPLSPRRFRIPWPHLRVNRSTYYDIAMSVTREPTLPGSHTSGLAVKLPIRLGGIVIEGDRRGRELGYPTANVALPRGLIVPEAVFAGTVQRADGSTYWSAISVGRRETFYGSSGVNLLEAFLLDFTGDLYGEHLSMSLLEMVRGQARFDSVADLIAQIALDVESVRRLAELVDTAS